MDHSRQQTAEQVVLGAGGLHGGGACYEDFQHHHELLEAHRAQMKTCLHARLTTPTGL